MPEGYRVLARAEFLRMRATALNKLARTEPREGSSYEEGLAAYEEVNQALSAGSSDAWALSYEEWAGLEGGELPIPPPPSSRPRLKAQIVSNEHDCVSAIYIIQRLRDVQAEIVWRHPEGLSPTDVAPEGTALTVLIGGPKAPGISNVAEMFYEADREGFLELYSAQGMVARVLKTQAGDTLCCMAGGPSKINTLMAAYELMEDQQVLAALNRS